MQKVTGRSLALNTTVASALWEIHEVWPKTPLAMHWGQPLHFYKITPSLWLHVCYVSVKQCNELSRDKGVWILGQCVQVWIAGRWVLLSASGALRWKQKAPTERHVRGEGCMSDAPAMAGAFGPVSQISLSCRYDSVHPRGRQSPVYQVHKVSQPPTWVMKAIHQCDSLCIAGWPLGMP